MPSSYEHQRTLRLAVECAVLNGTPVALPLATAQFILKGYRKRANLRARKIHATKKAANRLPITPSSDAQT